jgi:O-Antigen ligase
MKRSQAIIAGGLVALVAIMPFHAFIVIYLGSLIGHQAAWQSWKDILAVILAICGLVILYKSPKTRRRMTSRLNLLIVGFIAISFIVSMILHPSISGILYGIKTDLEFLVLFIIAQLVATRKLETKIASIILVTGMITAIIGILLVTILPHDLLSHFGYNASTIQPFQAVDPAITAIRTPSTLSGPNQFGCFLIIPLVLAISQLMRRPKWIYGLVIALTSAGIWISYSRIALIGAIVGAIVTIIIYLPKKQMVMGIFLTVAVVGASGFGILQLSHTNSKVQYYILHQSDTTTDPRASTNQHISSFDSGIKVIKDHPLGLGLGTAGPASYHTNQPIIPESYYLQIAIETGLLGLLLFFTVIIDLTWQLILNRRKSYVSGVLGALIGISIVNIVLHGWADATTGIVFWILAGVVVGVIGTDREDYV